jgi:UDPglucose 6-dehydrogenase
MADDLRSARCGDRSCGVLAAIIDYQYIAIAVLFETFNRSTDNSSFVESRHDDKNFWVCIYRMHNDFSTLSVDLILTHIPRTVLLLHRMKSGGSKLTEIPLSSRIMGMTRNIAIIGSGTVGQATGLGFLRRGHKVVFYDIDDEIINGLNGSGYEAKNIHELDANMIDTFFFMVPTPTKKGELSLDCMKNTVKIISVKLREKRDYFVFVMRSTILPGTTTDILIPIIERESGKKAGKDFGVAMNPEYLREASAEDDFNNPWTITIGSLDKKTKDFMADIYRSFDCPVHHLSLIEAEMQKYVHNSYNATKIAFFNEMRLISHNIGIDPEKIFEITISSAEGFWNEQYGLRDHGPFEGKCLPKDIQAFHSWAKKKEIEMDILRGVITSNKKFGKIWKKKKIV